MTVIIVNYFSSEMLPKCLASLKEADEIIIVDNSVDANEQAALEALAKGNDKIQLIFNNENAGFAKAVNQGAAAAKSGAILLLNPDAYVTKGTLRILCNALFQKGVGAVGPLIQFPDGKEQAGGRRLTPTPARAFAKLFGFSRIGLMKDHNLAGTLLPDTPEAVEAISGACMLIKKDVFDQLKGFDEGYIMHCEDLDFCMRVRLAGYKLLFVPDAVVIHKKGHSSVQQPLWVAWHLHKGMLRYYQKFFRKNYPAPLWFLVKLGVYLRFMAVATMNLGLRVFQH